MRNTVKFEAFCFRFLGLPDWRRISAIGCIFNLQPHWDWMICLRLAAFTRLSTGLFYYAILVQGESFNCCSSALKGEDMNNNTDTLRFWLLGHGHKDNPWSASRLIWFNNIILLCNITACFTASIRCCNALSRYRLVVYPTYDVFFSCLEAIGDSP